MGDKLEATESTDTSFPTSAWALFDRIVALAAPAGIHSNPWERDASGQLHYKPDYDTLVHLLTVPLQLKSISQTGIRALALDVWLSYELRRAGFDSDQVWPRPVQPRVLPASVAAMLASLPKEKDKKKEKHVAEAVATVMNYINTNASIPNITSPSASILGKNYVKQVDVIITDWATGPELLISTKRMDSSYAKNAPNRVEESYGDAKNLRLRHPLAALGFAFGLRSDILDKSPKTFDWICDLLVKLAREDDAYHATCLILMQYDDESAVTHAKDKVLSGKTTVDAAEIVSDSPTPVADAGNDAGQEATLVPDEDTEAESQGVLPLGTLPGGEENSPLTLPAAAIDRDVEHIKKFPRVVLRHDETPDELLPGRFLATLITHVLSTTPVDMHEEARRRRKI